MSKEDLIPFNQMSEEEHRKLAIMGGKAVSQRKKYAAKLREMKKRGLKDSDIDWFVKRIEDPECNLIEIQDYIDRVKDDLHPAQRVSLIRAMTDFHKAAHGEKIKTENTNYNFNINANIEEAYAKRIKKVKDESVSNE